MTPTNPDDTAAVVRTYCDAWLVGDTKTVVALYHDDLVLQWPGRHRFAGTHDGLQASIEALLGLQAMTNRVPVEIIDVLVGERSVAVTVRERWTRDSRGSRNGGEDEVFEHLRVLDYTVENAKLRSCRVYESAQREIDDWLASAPESETATSGST